MTSRLWICVAALAGCGDEALAPADTATDTTGPNDSLITDGSADLVDTYDSADLVDTYDSADAALEDTYDSADIAPEDIRPPAPTPVMDGLVRGVDPIFWHNMDDFVFGAVAPSDVRLYVAVLNANHFAQRRFRAYGAELIRRPESFFANVLVPFVERYADVLWAIDCMNEPEAIVSGPDGNYADWGVSWSEMRAYLAACSDVVHSYGGRLVRASAGSGWHDWHNLGKGHYDGLGFDFLDAHVYLDDWSLPAASTLASLPIIIGECGQKSERWDDGLQTAATRACFSQAKSGGYAAALAWYYDYVGSSNHLAAKNADGSWRPIGALFSEYDGGAAFQTGLNWAWLGGAYDHDFAPNPLHPTWGTAYNSAAASAVIADYDATGIAVMRLWAFEGQEGLPFHALYADFDDTLHGFGPIDRVTTSLALIPDGLAVSVATAAKGWQGIERVFSADMPFDLSPTSIWHFRATNHFDRPIGVNLFFVVDEGSGPVTYQTTTAGQLWLDPNATAEHAVDLTAAEFATAWARDDAPTTRVARPSDAALQSVVKIGVRIYFDAPATGTLDLASLFIR